jgi:aconitase A
MPSLDSLRTLKTLQIDDKTYHYFSLPDAAKSLGDLDKLPMSLKVLLENLLRWEDERPSPAPTSRPSPPGSRSAAPTAKSSTARRGC